MSLTNNKKGISSFSVILIMVVLTIIGIGVVPMVGIQYTPTQKEHNLGISYQWNNTSAKTVEQEVTSKLEGVLSSIKNLKEITSNSMDNGGEISLVFKEDSDVDVARFEVITKIRQIYNSLPDGVSFPTLSTSASSEKSVSIMTYTLNSPLPTNVIEEYAQKSIVNRLVNIDGIGEVYLYGATPFEWVVEFDYQKTNKLLISSSDIQNAIVSNFSLNEIIGELEDSNGKYNTIKVSSSQEVNSNHFENIVIKKSGDRIIYLRDIAKVSYKQSLPRNYYRINGLNTINITIYAESGVNTLKLIDDIKQEVAIIEEGFINDFSMMLSYDTSSYIQEELDKIYIRTAISVAILLILVLLVSRSLRYTLIIIITLVVNILISFILYYLLDLELHIYSLAGITVSLGIVIDTAIMMIDHYGYYRNKKVFFSILGALLTTIGSLTIVFFLPEHQRTNLVDFSMVIIINLTVSIVIAYLFIPSLMDKIKITQNKSIKSRKKIQKILKFNRIYTKYIMFGRRFRWVFILVIILLFGFPVFMLPTEIDEEKTEHKKFAEIYNKTIGTTFYDKSVRPIVDVALGGTLRLFAKGVNDRGGYRDPQETKLTIRASMPQGCSVHQLNDVMLAMENYLSQFDEIEMFQTRVYSYSNAQIVITFKDPDGSFPFVLMDLAIKKAINYGGASWTIYGVGQEHFSNSIYSGYQQNNLELVGYNYETLYRYANQLVDTLSKNHRVKDLIIKGSRYSTPKQEFYLDYDREKATGANLNINNYFNYLKNQLYDGRFTEIADSKGTVGVVLTSNESESFDIWHVDNNLVDIDTLSFKLSDFGTIQKRQMGNNINKKNQEYILNVGYNFVGSYKLQSNYTNAVVENFQDSVLPIGYKISRGDYYWRTGEKTQYMLLALIVIVIYFICAIMFESLNKPLVIILLIPLAFVGLFLTFSIGKFHFDQGGYAAFVLLCGLVVNAGIYLVYEYISLSTHNSQYTVRTYIKSFNRKIIPITLTVVSTILGLAPFLTSGNKEVFWFSFAAGSIGGIVFSLIAIWLFLPILIPLKGRKLN